MNVKSALNDFFHGSVVYQPFETDFTINNVIVIVV